jgi:hypothetical protein
MRGGCVAFDLGMVKVDDRLSEALDALRGDVWISVLRDSTSPVTLLINLNPKVLDRGIGLVGNIPIPEFNWDLLAPLHFSHVATRDLGTMPAISREGLMMARALVRDGVLRPCDVTAEGGGTPNGYLFPVPKNETKASMIVHLVGFNKKHSRPHSFCLPSVEDLSFLIQIHNLIDAGLVYVPF